MEPEKPHWLKSFIEAIKEHNGLIPPAGKDDPLRLATILGKVLAQPDHKVSPETKERARAWVAKAAVDPVVRRAFRESSSEAVQSFLEADEPQQHDILRGLSKTWLTQTVELFSDENFEKLLPETSKMISQWAENAERRQARREGRPYFTKEQIKKADEEWKAFQEWFQKTYPDIEQQWEDKAWVKSLIPRAEPYASSLVRCAGCHRKFGFFQRRRNIKTIKNSGLTIVDLKMKHRVFIHESCALLFLLQPRLYYLIPSKFNHVIMVSGN